MSALQQYYIDQVNEFAALAADDRALLEKRAIYAQLAIAYATLANSV